MSKSVTLSFSAISVVLPNIKHNTIFAKRPKIFSQTSNADGSINVDAAPIAKRQWRFEYDAPLTSSEYADLETLCYTHQFITLTEDWVDAGTYTVFFKSLDQQLTGPSELNRRLIMEFQEI